MTTWLNKKLPQMLWIFWIFFFFNFLFLVSDMPCIYLEGLLLLVKMTASDCQEYHAGRNILNDIPSQHSCL